MPCGTSLCNAAVTDRRQLPQQSMHTGAGVAFAHAQTSALSTNDAVKLPKCAAEHNVISQERKP
jgi:hypothetical protein